MRKSFDLTIEIDGKERKLVLTPGFQAISEIEGHELHRRGDGALMQILSRFSQQVARASDYVAVIHGCMRAAGVRDVSAEELGEALVEAGITTFAVLCVHILQEALDITPDGKKRARTPRGGGASKK